MSLNNLDELLLQLQTSAETIEKMINNTRMAGETIVGMAKIVADSRHELVLLLSVKNKEAFLGDCRIRQLFDLAARYQDLEGALKEMRNDLYKKHFVREPG